MRTTLNGYTKQCEKIVGGIKSVALVNVQDVEQVKYDYVKNTCKEIVLKTNRKFAHYQFKEDEASYSEQLSRNATAVTVAHRLVLLLERVNSTSKNAVSELLEASNDGVIAVLVDASGLSWVVGHSVRFAGERPLKLARVATSTKERLSQKPEFEITLESYDDSLAVAFVGKIKT